MSRRCTVLMENYWHMNKSRLLRQFSEGLIIILPGEYPQVRSCDSNRLPEEFASIQRNFHGIDPLVKSVIEEQWREHVNDCARVYSSYKSLHGLIHLSNSRYGIHKSKSL